MAFPLPVQAAAAALGVDVLHGVADVNVPLLQQILAAVCAQSGGGSGSTIVNVGGYQIPAFNSTAFTYLDSGATNIGTEKFRQNGVLVGTLTFTYVQDATTVANASIASITQS